ncbi:MAG TPA: M48 family metalloprotease [Kofleriaceae bacterium]
MTKPFLVFLSWSCAACVVGVGGAPEQPDPEPEVVQSCDDPRYGDGVCNTDLTCLVPDIDCFRTFVDDAAAAVWYAQREAGKAADEGRPPRALLAPSDPRFVQMRKLLDAGWQAFSKARPVGRLVEFRPALVMIEDPIVNAFVTAESATQSQVFAVMVHTGLAAAALAEDGRLGVLLHELQHIVGTHGLGNVEEDLRLHYVAGDGVEPIGRLQTDDRIVHEAIESWMNMASDIGPYSLSALGGFPYDGPLWGMLDMLADDGVEDNGANCRTAADQIASLRHDLVDARDDLDEHLTISPTTQQPINATTLSSRINEALGRLREDCMPGSSLTFVDAFADLVNAPPQEIAESLTASDLQLVSNKHVVDALSALTRDRRNKMRALEASLPQGRPWSAARYFSEEEDADDTAVMVLRAAGRNAESYAAAALTSVAKRGAEAAARCQTILDAGEVPPYGVDLLDTHHASCWRAYHALQIARLKPQAAARPPATEVVRARPLVGLPRPPRPELVIHE